MEKMNKLSNSLAHRAWGGYTTSPHHHITISPYHHITTSIFLILAFLLPVFAFASAQPTQLMEQANAAYTDKKYDEAIKTYEQLLGEGFSSVVLHYNLGNAYFRTQQLGKAILHYEKAEHIAPTDEDVRHNLAVAYALQPDQMDNIPAFFLSQWRKNLRSRLSTSTWAILGLLLLWGSATGFILWLMGKQRSRRKRGFIVGFVLLCCCIIPFLLSVDRHIHDQHSKEAVLLVKETQLHFAPDADSKVVLTIHEGLKMDLQDKISDWYKVRLPNGEVGWLPVATVEEI